MGSDILFFILIFSFSNAKKSLQSIGRRNDEGVNQKKTNLEPPRPPKPPPLWNAYGEYKTTLKEGSPFRTLPSILPWRNGRIRRANFDVELGQVYDEHLSIRCIRCCCCCCPHGQVCTLAFSRPTRFIQVAFPTGIQRRHLMAVGQALSIRF